MKVALEIAEKTISIAEDWHAPLTYDIEAPASWDDAKVIPGDEDEGWLYSSEIRRKMREALAAYDSAKHNPAKGETGDE